MSKELAIKLHAYIKVEDDQDVRMAITKLREMLCRGKFEYQLHEAFIREGEKETEVEL